MIDRFPLELPLQLETSRLLLRPYHAGDGGWYYQASLRNRQHLARFEAGNPILKLENEAQAEELVCGFAAEWAARSHFFLAAFTKENGQFAAQVYIGPVSWELPEFQIGYFADASHEGQGYVSEAVQAALELIFTHLGARRVSLECSGGNLRSQRVAQRAGMHCEGHLRQNHLGPNGEMEDTLIYAILRREYYERLRATT